MELAFTYLNSVDAKLTLIGVALSSIIFFGVVDSYVRDRIAISKKNKKPNNSKPQK